MMPPETELSSPIMAFWTVFDRAEQDDEVEGVELSELAFAEEAQEAHQAEIDDDRAEELLEHRQMKMEHAFDHGSWLSSGDLRGGISFWGSAADARPRR